MILETGSDIPSVKSSISKQFEKENTEMEAVTTTKRRKWLMKKMQSAVGTNTK